MSSANAQSGKRRNCSTGGQFAWAVRLMSWGKACAMVALVALLPSGCARRAYNDVYVENMAAEIRDLEDQLYEFDGEYRMMEQQLDALKAENARLRGAMPAPSNRSLRQEVVPSPSDGAGSDYFVPRGSNAAPGSSSTPGKANPSLAPSLEIGPTPPSTPNATAPGTGNANTPGSTLPKSTSPSVPGLDRSPTPAPSITPSPLPPPKPVPGAEQFNPNDLRPPTIEDGEPMPPAFPPVGTNPSGPVTMQSDNDLEVELGQIKLPAQLASAKLDDGPDEATLRSGQIHPAAQMPSDTRIVELKFHPTLCRAVNADQQGDDDWLYLVVQPYNTAGEFVPIPADLMILALDLSREEKKATIGRWTFSAADVKSKMTPIGSSQGIHLSLSFSGPAPQCDRVVVFAYYTLPDGRRLPAETEIMLNNMHRQNTAWVPRSGKSEVRQASHQAPASKPR